jgi:single stranded DNA-binding protein
MKNVKLNAVQIAGNIASVEIRTGQNGRFGTISIAIDDGYFSKSDQPGQKGQWVDRSYFIDCKVNENDLKKLYVDPCKGDQIVIEGKLVQERWKDNANGQDRSALKVSVKHVVSHTPKALIEMGKSSGLIPANQSQNQGFNNQQAPSQTGYQQAPPARQNQGYQNQGYQQQGN